MATADEMSAPSPPSLEKLGTSGALALPGAYLDRTPKFVARLVLPELRRALDIWRCRYRDEHGAMSMASVCYEFSIVGRAFDQWIEAAQYKEVAPPAAKPPPRVRETHVRTTALPPPELLAMRHARRKTPNRSRPARNKAAIDPRSSRATATSPQSSITRYRPVTSSPPGPTRLGTPASVNPLYNTFAREPPSCLRPDWPLRPAYPPVGSTPDAPFEDWQRALRRNAQANCDARARDWAFRASYLTDVRLMTPSKVVPWHVDDGEPSHRKLAGAIECLSTRSSELEATAAGNEQLGRALAGWSSFELHRARALALEGREFVVNL